MEFQVERSRGMQLASLALTIILVGGAMALAFSAA